jgi:hypothetical protein
MKCTCLRIAAGKSAPQRGSKNNASIDLAGFATSSPGASPANLLQDQRPNTTPGSSLPVLVFNCQRSSLRPERGQVVLTLSPIIKRTLIESILMGLQALNEINWEMKGDANEFRLPDEG